MNTLTFNAVEQKSFEVSVSANGHQYFGYAKLLSLDTLNDNNDHHNDQNKAYYIHLIDAQQQAINFQLDRHTYQRIQARYESIQPAILESLYLWIEQSATGHITHWRLFKSTMPLQQLMPIYQASYNFEALYQLFNLVESLQTIPLKVFLRTILEDAELMKSFVSIPASKQHHHSFPGGLLAHSLECAAITMQNLEVMSDMSESEKEVTTIAALLHDIGKTKTLGQGQHTSIGHLLDHEQFTLLAISNPLNRLTEYWPQGSETLQYLLMWTHKKGFCRYVGGNVIKLADQLSTSMSLRRMAFKDKPNYYHFSHLNIGQQTHCVNRLL